MTPFISVIQAAERAGVTRATVNAWLRRGILRGERIGYTWIVQADDLERAAGTVKPRRPRLGAKKKAPSVTS